MIDLLLLEDDKIWYNNIINSNIFNITHLHSLKDFILFIENDNIPKYNVGLIDLYIPMIINSNNLKCSMSTYGNGIGFFLKYINPDICDIIIGNSMDYSLLKSNFFNYTINKEFHYNIQKKIVEDSYIKKIISIVESKKYNNKKRFKNEI